MGVNYYFSNRKSVGDSWLATGILKSVKENNFGDILWVEEITYP